VTLDLPHGGLLVALGAAVGACGTLIGAGGGFLLVPALLMLDPTTPPRTVTAISLAVVCANALSGSIAYARAGRVDYAAGGAFAAATLPGAVIGVFIASAIDRGPFSLLFGAGLLALALTSLRSSTRPKVSVPVPGIGQVPVLPGEAPPPAAAGGGRWKRRVVERSGEVHEYEFDAWIGILLSVAVGFVASILGIGGGVIHVPALVMLLRFPVHVATATSHFTLVFTALVATIVHVAHGDLSGPGVPLEVGLLVLGVVPGAQLGAFWAKRAPSVWILRLLAVALALVAVRLLVVGARS
jgi:uncharacterized membrane protein YfcA